MPDENQQTDASIDYGVVRCALQTELAERGHYLSSDTTGMNQALHIMGPGDVASAVFEFKPNADDAVYDLMYQGAWVAGMPPRFVVMSGEEAGNPSLETLEQMKAIPLLFDADGDKVTFPELGRLLEGYFDVR